MTIDPKISAIVNVLIALIGAAASLGAEWTTLFGTGTAQQIVLVATIAATVVGSVNAVLHGVSSNQPGPLVKGPPNAQPPSTPV